LGSIRGKGVGFRGCDKQKKEVRESFKRKIVETNQFHGVGGRAEVLVPQKLWSFCEVVIGENLKKVVVKKTHFASARPREFDPGSETEGETAERRAKGLEGSQIVYK